MMKHDTTTQIKRFVLEKGDVLLRPRQVHAPHGMLPFCKSTLYAMIKRGEIGRPIRLSNRISCFRRSDILAFIARQEEQ